MWDAASTPVRRYAIAFAGLALFMAALTHAGAAGGSQRAPRAPTEVVVLEASADAVTLTWQYAKRPRQPVSFALYRNADPVSSTTQSLFTFADLACGTSYVLGVAAVDAAGTQSAVAGVVTSTESCPPAEPAPVEPAPPPPSNPLPPPPAPAPADTTPPTAPGNLTVPTATQTELAFAWSSSQDDTGVAGYTTYLDGARAGSTTDTLFTAGGLACGRTYQLAVEAYDAASNVSPRSTLNASTAACPAPPPDPSPDTSCDKVASPVGSDTAAGTLSAPYRTAQQLADSLSTGQIGCLRAGSYSTSSTYVLELDTGGYRIRSYPGERARLVGNINVRSSAAGVTLSHLDIEGTGGSNTLKIYSADVVVEDNDITNLGRGQSCMMLGSNSGYGQAARTIVRRNRFHDCGSAANDNKDHGIYAQNLADGQILQNVFWNSAAYAIQLYPNAQRTRVAYNVVDGDSPSVRGGILFGGDSSYASSDNVVEHNVLAYAVTYNITSTWGTAVGSANVARDNCVWAAGMSNVNTSKGGFTASANVTADPLFVDRPGRDYRIASTSPCAGVVGAASLLG